MGSVNKVILVGNLGRDAELRYTPGGAAVANFSMATTDVWKDKSGQRQERTEWHRCALWRNPESVNEYLTKGKQVYVEGSLQTRKYEKGGQDHYSTEVKVERLVLLGGRGAGDAGSFDRDGSSGHGGRQPDAMDGPRSSVDLSDDDIPF